MKLDFSIAVATIALFSGWYVKRFFTRPPVLDPVVKGFIPPTFPLHRFCKRGRNSVDGDENGYPLIAGLFGIGRPLTISRAIAIVVVNSLQRVTLGFYAHVFQEFDKFVPLLANLNSPSSVTRISLIVGVFAPLHHRRPRGISWRKPACWTMSVREPAGVFFLPTSARFGVAASKGVACDLKYFSAFAPDRVVALFSFSRAVTNYC